MKKIFILPVILIILAGVFINGCTDSGGADLNEGESLQVSTDGGPVSIDLTGGADAFIGFEPEFMSLEVLEQGEMLSFNFIGVSLNTVLESAGVTEFTKIELVSSDSGTMDITEMAESEAGLFLAWSESGIPETPFTAFPKDASTGNLLMRSIIKIIIT